MANRYWVGGSGDWSDTSHWSATSGGVGGSSVPTIADAVYIESGTANLTSNSEARTILITASPFPGSKLITNGFTLDIVGITGSGSSSNYMTLDMTNSIVNIIEVSGFGTNGAFSFGSAANWQIITANSSIRVNRPNNQSIFTLYRTFNEIRVIASLTNLSFFGNGTINNLVIDPGNTIKFGVSTTVNVNNISLLGTSLKPISLQSNNAGVRFTISKSSGVVDGTFLNIQDSAATGGATWNANSSVNGGNNTGWNFVGPYIPVANFSQSPSSGVRPLTVNFVDMSSGPPTSWLWSFGDGTTSTLQNPTKTYNNAGTYSVSLQATNSVGSNTITKSNLITTTVATYQREATGTILNSGIYSRKLRANRYASGSILNTGGVSAVVLRDPQAIEEKRYLYKVYDPTGSYIETWSDVESLPEFTHELNELGSTMTVTLARNSDSVGTTTSSLLTEASTVITTQSDDPILVTTDSRNQVGEGSSVLENNRVDVYVFYGEVSPLLTQAGEPINTENGEEILATSGAPNGKRIFTGFISEINSRYGNTETTVVQLSSYGFDLDQFVYSNASDETTVTFNSTDPSVIAQQVMDRFATLSSLVETTYTRRTSTSISLSSTVVSYTFKANTFGDVIKKILELLPSNWYFYVGLGDNTIYFRERSTTPQHVFYLGKHIKSLDLKSSILSVVNDVYFTGGGEPALYKRYTATPAARTRRGLKMYSDNRVTLEASAETISEGAIDEGNKKQYRSTVEILTKVYDIESIEVGDVIGFRNFGNFVDELTMQVVGRAYSPDTVQLQLDTKPPTVNKRLEDLRRNQIVAENQDVPIEPV